MKTIYSTIQLTLAITLTLTLTTLTITTNAVDTNTRFMVLNSKDKYKTKLNTLFKSYFDDIVSSKVTYPNFSLKDDTNNILEATAPNGFWASPFTIKGVEGTPDLKDDCSCTYTLTAPVVQSFLAFDVKHTSTSSEVKTGTLAFTLTISSFSLERTVSPSDPTLFVYKVKNYALAVSGVSCAGNAKTECDTFLGQSKMTTEFANYLKDNNLDAQLQMSVGVLNKSNSLSLDLQTTLLTLNDNKSRWLTTRRSAATSCKDTDTFITEKFSASILEGYATKATDFQFDTTKAPVQVFYDFSLIDELIQSKVKNKLFNFTVSKDTASTYNKLGFTIQDLSFVLYDVVGRFIGSQEFFADCYCSSATSQFFPQTAEMLKAGAVPIVTTAHFSCDLKESRTLEVIETVFAAYTITLKKTLASQKFSVAFSPVDLYDYGIKSPKAFNVDLLKNTMITIMDSYLKDNAFVLFKLDSMVPNGNFEFVDGKGLLYFEPTTALEDGASKVDE